MLERLSAISFNVTLLHILLFYCAVGIVNMVAHFKSDWRDTEQYLPSMIYSQTFSFIGWPMVIIVCLVDYFHDLETTDIEDTEL